MRPLDQLIDLDDPALPSVRRWVAEAEVPCEILEPSPRRAEVLLALQVTTRSPLGALAYETGGLIIDDGWLRVLGSGHPRLQRDVVGWNASRGSGFLLVADDAAGGFFALNGGAFGADRGNVYYWPPDSVDWEPLEMGFTEFLRAFLTSRLAAFYETLRWSTWRHDLISLSGDRCYSFYPFLWTREGSLEGSHRATIPVTEAFDVKADIVRQLAAPA
jgi:hypothetical protein